MPFAFVPGGLLLAMAVLGGTLLLFGLALKVLDWSVDTTRGTALTGIVTGLHDWQANAHQADEPSPGVAPFEESAPAVVALESVKRRPARQHRDR